MPLFLIRFSRNERENSELQPGQGRALFDSANYFSAPNEPSRRNSSAKPSHHSRESVASLPANAIYTFKFNILHIPTIFPPVVTYKSFFENRVGLKIATGSGNGPQSGRRIEATPLIRRAGRGYGHPNGPADEEGSYELELRLKWT